MTGKIFRQIDARLNLEQRTRAVPRGLTKRVGVAHAEAFYFVHGQINVKRGLVWNASKPQNKAVTNGRD